MTIRFVSDIFIEEHDPTSTRRADLLHCVRR